MMDMLKGKMKPSNTGVAETLARAIAATEHQQSQAVNRALAEAGEDARSTHDIDGRVQQILDGADAIYMDEFKDWWFREIGARWLDNPEKARQYAGRPEDWPDIKQQWHTDHVEHGTVDPETPVDEVAERHVESVFGVTLPEFYENVVTWDENEQAMQIFTGPFNHHTELIALLHKRIEELNATIEEQQAEIERLEGSE